MERGSAQCNYRLWGDDIIQVTPLLGVVLHYHSLCLHRMRDRPLQLLKAGIIKPFVWEGFLLLWESRSQTRVQTIYGPNKGFMQYSKVHRIWR